MPMACQEHLENNKNRINLSFSVVETGLPGEKPLQAKLRADYFSLSLFLYLQCLEKKLKKIKRVTKILCSFNCSFHLEIKRKKRLTEINQ
jgi:hypothetical protein